VFVGRRLSDFDGGCEAVFFEPDCTATGSGVECTTGRLVRGAFRSTVAGSGVECATGRLVRGAFRSTVAGSGVECATRLVRGVSRSTATGSGVECATGRLVRGGSGKMLQRLRGFAGRVFLAGKGSGTARRTAGTSTATSALDWDSGADTNGSGSQHHPRIASARRLTAAIVWSMTTSAASTTAAPVDEPSSTMRRLSRTADSMRGPATRHTAAAGRLAMPTRRPAAASRRERIVCGSLMACQPRCVVHRADPRRPIYCRQPTRE
jgi:hypothetical protein